MHTEPNYEVQSRRQVSVKAAAHAGEQAVLVVLSSGFRAWGFSAVSSDEAEKNALANAKDIEQR
ncbi:hypothetical protein [Pseudomonas sp. UMAB-40]|uniref:hypothetical protein n=1 Tax=Pseudomonas sp. UMAB-40 TaxID=1365407 RepID=UPI001C5927A9|nr:hypothetical protein [Pseudomonas sp. UMAB-40]